MRLVRGRQGGVLSPEGVRTFLELVPHAGVADVSDAAHTIAGESNDRFPDAVLAFVTRLPG